MLVALEKEAGPWGTDLNYSRKLAKVITCNNLDLDKDQQKPMFRDIYNYWRNKRINVRSPLLRPFWVKNELGPFKNRDHADNLSLRNRALRVDELDIRQTIIDDLAALKQLLLLMQTRESQERNLLVAQTEFFKRHCLKVFHKMGSTPNIHEDSKSREAAEWLANCP
jgi:hypothetical protein